LSLGDYHGVRLKVSGILALAPDAAKEDDLGRWCRQARKVFGLERLIWGAGLATTFDADDYLTTARRVEGCWAGSTRRAGGVLLWQRQDLLPVGLRPAQADTQSGTSNTQA
jgi:hypothetical protein